MTNGIIQEVFKKSWLKYRERELLEELQQELIEKIKQENFLTLDSLRVLIGDSND